jgi:uncharacterized protein YkwD
MVLALAGGAVSYGGPPAPPRQDRDTDVVHTAILAALGEARLPIPRRDGRLDAYARALAGLGTRSGAPGREQQEWALHRSGIAEPPPHLTLAHAPRASLGWLAEDVAAGTPRAIEELGGRKRPLRLGVGAAEIGGELHFVLVLLPVALELAPVPRALPSRGTASIAIELGRGYSRPLLIVAPPAGEVASRPMTRAAGRAAGYAATLVCGRDGVHRVEVGADGARGPEVLVNFPVYCGLPPPESPPAARASESVPLSEAAAEAALLEAIARDRRLASLPALKSDPRLAAVARVHATEMRLREYVGHTSTTTGTALDRARRAGLRPRVLAENVARARSVEDAHGGFLDSPGHRANILLRDATHVGVAVRFADATDGRRELYVTQLFARY